MGNLTSINPSPNPVRKINKAMVVGAFVLLCLIFTGAFLLAETRNQRDADEQEKEATTFVPEKVNLESFDKLPGSYADVKDPEPAKIYIEAEASKKETEVRAVPVRQRARGNAPPLQTHQARAKSPAQLERERALKSNILFQQAGMMRRTEANGRPASVPDDDLSKRDMLQAMLNGANGRPQETSATRKDQGGKQNFLDAQAQAKTAVYLDEHIQAPVSPYQIMAGTVLPGVLITGINSDLPGQIIGQVRENVYDTVTGRYVLIPQGTKVIGKYDNMVSWGQERALLAWSRLIFPNGSSIVLDGMPGVDLGGYAGLKDRVNNHYLRLTGAVLLSTFLNVGARVAGGDVEKNREYPTVGQQIASEIGSGINRAGQKIVDRELNVPPTIEIDPGHPFNIMVNKDIVLKPYNG